MRPSLLVSTEQTGMFISAYKGKMNLQRYTSVPLIHRLHCAEVLLIPLAKAKSLYVVELAHKQSVVMSL